MRYKNNPNVIKRETKFVEKLGKRLVWPRFFEDQHPDEPVVSSYDASNGHIEYLYLKANLNDILCPAEMGALSKLKRLEIEGLETWDFQQIGLYLAKLKDLENIIITHSKLITFPDWICSLPKLIEITLDHNQIDTIPRDISKLNRLKVLHLQYNRFTEIPPNLQSHPSLESLSMKGNQITTIPPWIHSLPQLKSIYLQENCITEIPASLFHMRNLQDLWLDHNQIRFFGDNVIPEDHNPRVSLKNNPLEPFFQKYLSTQNWSSELHRFNTFIPAIIEKIQKNLPLDEFDIKFPLYGKYREILTKEIEAHPTAIAMQIKAILNVEDKMPILF